MKVSALAREVGVSPSLISQIERGQSRPSVSTLFALAEALDIPMDAFFRDAEDREAIGDDNGGGRADPARESGAAPERPAGGERTPRGGVPAHQFERRSAQLVRRGERAAIAIEGGVRWERLTSTGLAEFEFMELVYSPGAESHATQYRHPGMEIVLLLEGRLDIHVGFDDYELEVGDSLCFPSTTAHRYVNPTEQTTRAVTVILRDWGDAGAADPNRRQ
jgi:transcriptional regulator with XRE-family HTH domain